MQEPSASAEGPRGLEIEFVPVTQMFITGTQHTNSQTASTSTNFSLATRPHAQHILEGAR